MRKKSAVQLDREINAALHASPHRTGSRRRGHHLEAARTADGRLPLYGHTSESSAHLVADYPYGFKARTQIRYWLEGPKKDKGWRFVSQTMNPKTGKWNKPKASTYTEFGAAMFIDHKGHVDWEGVGQYSDDQKILNFVKAFPGANMSVLRQFAPQKMKYLRGIISGQIVWKINGVPTASSEADIERAKKELETWEEINVWLDQAAS